MKDKQNPDIVYALADYKQLVLAYKTKHAQLISALSFWKTSVFWLIVLTTSIVVGVIFMFSDARTSLTESKKNINSLNAKIAAISQELDNRLKQLESTQEELGKKEIVIKELEKSLSTASKKLLEKLLKEQENPKTTK